MDIENEYKKRTGKDAETHNTALMTCHTESYIKWLEENVIKLFAIPDVSFSLRERGVSQKMYEAEQFVKSYIEAYNKPPTYEIVAYKLNVKKTAAYFRLRHCRDLMVRRQ